MKITKWLFYKCDICHERKDIVLIRHDIEKDIEYQIRFANGKRICPQCYSTECYSTGAIQK